MALLHRQGKLLQLDALECLAMKGNMPVSLEKARCGKLSPCAPFSVLGLCRALEQVDPRFLLWQDKVLHCILGGKF